MIALAVFRRVVFAAVLAVATAALVQPPESVRTADDHSQECAP